jgi:hypothetical protein
MAKKPEAKKPAAPAPKPQTTAVSTRSKNDLTIVAGDQAPAHIRQDTQRGSENVGMKDLVMPRLEIVQALSPALKNGDAGYIQGAKQGDLNNSVTRELYGDGVLVVPVHYSEQYLVWKKFSEGGGFFGAFNTMEDANAKAEAEGGKQAHIEVVDTPLHLCMVLNPKDGSITECMIPMAKTKAKVSRKLNSQIKLLGRDRFADTFRFSTVREKNKKGQEYYNFAVARVGFTPKAGYEAAERLYEAIKAGTVRTVMDTSHMGVDDESGGDGDSKM